MSTELEIESYTWPTGKTNTKLVLKYSDCEIQFEDIGDLNVEVEGVCDQLYKHCHNCAVKFSQVLAD